MAVQRITQAYKFRLRIDTAGQYRSLYRHAGGARFAYNWGLDQIKTALTNYKTAKENNETPEPIPGHFELCKLWTEHKNNTPGLDWVSDVSSGTFQAALRNVHVARSNFFDSRTGRRQGRTVGFPRYKSRRKGQFSFQVHGGTLQVAGPRSLKLPKIGTIATYEATRKLRRILDKEGTCSSCTGTGTCKTCTASGRITCPSKLTDGHSVTKACKRCKDTGEVKCRDCKTKRGNTTATGTGTCGTCHGEGTTTAARLVACVVTRTPSGKWFAAITVERDRDIREKPTRRQLNGGTIGIDISPTGLTLSNGTILEPPRVIDRFSRRLATAQRGMSRRLQRDATTGHVVRSRRYDRARQRAALISEQIGGIRRDFVEQTVTALIHGVRPTSQHKALTGIHGHSRIVVEGFDLQQLAMTTARDTDIPNWVKRRRNRSMHDLAPGEIRTRLNMRSAWYGTEVVQAGKHDPTGRTCHRCGTVRTKPIRPWETEFRCDKPACGYKGDKRLNTAKTLAAYGGTSSSVRPEQRGDVKVARRDPVRPPSSPRKQATKGRGSLKREASDPDHSVGGKPEPNGPGGTSRGQPRDVQDTLW